MDRIKAKYAVMAMTLAFAGAGAFAHGTKSSSNDVTGSGQAAVQGSGDVSASGQAAVQSSSGADVKGSGEATTTAPNASAPSESSTMTNDADRGAQSASPGASAGAPYGNAYGYRRNEEIGRGNGRSDVRATNPADPRSENPDAPNVLNRNVPSSRPAPDEGSSQPGAEDNNDGTRSGQG